MDVDNYTPPPQVPPAVADGALLNVHEPRMVIGDRGAGWLTEGWDMFKAASGSWLLLCLAGIAVFCVINLIPFLNILNGALQPVWIASMLLACHAQRNGEPVKVSHLFAGFGPKLGRLVLSGVVIGFFSMCITLVCLWPLLIGLISAPDPQAFILEQDMNTLMLRMLVLMALLIPFMAAAWFAPALIIFGNVGVQQALLLSMKGCLKNSWPFLIYGLCLLVLGVLALFTFGLALLVIVPVVYLSLYLSFRDIYVD